MTQRDPCALYAVTPSGTRYDSEAILDPPDQSIYQMNTTKRLSQSSETKGPLDLALPEFVIHETVRYNKIVVLVSKFWSVLKFLYIDNQNRICLLKKSVTRGLRGKVVGLLKRL